MKTPYPRKTGVLTGHGGSGTADICPAVVLWVFGAPFIGFSVPVQAAIIPGRAEFVLTTSAGARDGANFDTPTGKSLNAATNGFWAYETNLTSFASVAGAQARSGAGQKVRIQPLSIAAEGELNAAAGADPMRDESASAQAGCRLDLVFELSVQHAYSISATNLGGVNLGTLLGQIILSGSSVEVFGSRLPADSGSSSQRGALPAGTYRLLAEFLLSPSTAPEASSGTATYSLRMEFDPILPRLNIERASTGVILSWTTNGTASFLLQSSTNLAGPDWTYIYGPYPVSEGQYSVEQSAAEGDRFYRLIIP